MKSHSSAVAQQLPHTVRFFLSCRVVIVLFMTMSLTAMSQVSFGPYVLENRTTNPLRAPFNDAAYPHPALVDLDSDGDLDVVLADLYGEQGYRYIMNVGTSVEPAFDEAPAWANPFYFVPFPLGGAPAFHDFDSDGDQDMLLGTMEGTIDYYINTGATPFLWSRQTTAWDATTKTGNPFHGLHLGEYASPFLADLDDDGDVDAIVGCSASANAQTIHAFLNDGNGTFTPVALSGVNPDGEELSPVLIDVDDDGLKDMVIGAKDGTVFFFQRMSTLTFQHVTSPANPFSGVNKGENASLSVGDLDHDGDEDLIMGTDNALHDIFYFRNLGGGTFEETVHFDNPFGGIATGGDSSPLFVDANNDETTDALVAGNTGQLQLLKQENGGFTVDTENNPFKDLDLPYSFTPSFVDIDNDGDKDLVGSGIATGDLYIYFYKNENGTFALTPQESSPFGHIVLDEGRADFGDVDGDGDVDLVVSDRHMEDGDFVYFLRFYKNTGTAGTPVFEEQSGAANPYGAIEEEFLLLPRLVDFDLDGDLDLVLGEGGDTVENADGNELSYYENIGSASAFVLAYRGNLIPQGDNPYEPAPAFYDIDADGDLDAIFGNASGGLLLYRNENAAVQLIMNSEPLHVALGAGPVVVDSELTLTDPDGDLVIQLQVKIDGFDPSSESIDFTMPNGLTGSFSESEGLLVVEGAAEPEVYEALLRSLAIEYFHSGSNGRKRSPTSPELTTIAKRLTISITDSDRTIPLPIERTISFATNSAPVFIDGAGATAFGGSVALDLTGLITDADGNLDLTTLAVIAPPASGASVSVSGGMLNLDYGNTTFSGTEEVHLRVCDDAGACDDAVIVISVSANTPPVVSDISVSTPYGGFVTVNLPAMASDAENNLALESFTVLHSLSSGATATIDGNFMLEVDYQGTTFAGLEEVVIEVCDQANACAQGTVTIEVVNTAPVISPTPIETSQGAIKRLNLVVLLEDAENNLDISSIEIVAPPSSGAVASLEMVSATEVNLVLDYSGVSFHGNETVTIRACDVTGACTERELTIAVEEIWTLQIFNAIAPNRPGDNKFFRVSNLPATNTVVIFNRWGDEVYSAKGYNNTTIRFDGLSNAGKALPSGTYFYKIEYQNGQGRSESINGYLTLIQ